MQAFLSVHIRKTASCRGGLFDEGWACRPAAVTQMFKFRFSEQYNFGAFMAPSDEGAVSYADWGREKTLRFD
jgi:hypothetical protein